MKYVLVSVRRGFGAWVVRGVGGSGVSDTSSRPGSSSAQVSSLGSAVKASLGKCHGLPVVGWLCRPKSRWKYSGSRRPVNLHWRTGVARAWAIGFILVYLPSIPLIGIITEWITPQLLGEGGELVLAGRWFGGTVSFAGGCELGIHQWRQRERCRWQW